jgi:hypothetical protein
MVSTEVWGKQFPDTNWLDEDDVHVNVVRLCLWTAATNGPIVHPPGDMSMEYHGEII